MNFTGNDIVCFDDAVPTLKHENRAWLNKNFNPSEKDYIQNSSNPARTLWKLWSCKESAYKVIVKKESTRFLNARRIVVELSNTWDNISRILYEDQVLWVKTFAQEKYVHSISSFSLEEIETTQFDVIPSCKQIHKSSLLIREKLKQKVITKYGSNDVTYSKNILGAPFIKIDRPSGQLDISFSHDGIFSAYSFIEKNRVIHS